MSTLKAFILVFLIAALGPEAISSYNVLLLSPICSKSYKNSIDPAIDQLIARGHEVTELAMEVNRNSTGIHQYELRELRKKYLDTVTGGSQDPFAHAGERPNIISVLYTISKEFTRNLLEDETFQRFLTETANDKFDVVIVNAIFNDVALLVAQKYNAPIIQWCPAGLPPFTSWVYNVPFPFSYVTTPIAYFKPPMSFINRLSNTVINLAINIAYQYFLMPAVEEVYNNYTKQSHPSLSEIRKNASLILANTHVAMEEARPTMPTVVKIGAMHCRPAQPLPKDLDDIASGSGQHGFIIFSLGSIIQGTQMPQFLVDIFLKVFGKLKQTVIWKFEGEARNIPPNVIFKDWIPQQDLMGHPNCRLAILHGGLNGLQEAVYHGVPVLGMPLGADRDGNLAIAVNSGMAEIFDWELATEEILFQTLDQLLNNPKYQETVKKLSAILRDRPETAAETAVYWIEYVIRHNGAPHLKSNADNVNLFQYFLLDVFAFILGCLLLALTSVFVGVKLLFTLTCGRNVAKINKIKKN